MTHGQSGTTDVAGLAQRDGEVVFTELVEHLKDGADFANTFVVATEGEKRISTSLIPCAGIFRGQVDVKAAQGGGRDRDDGSGGLLLSDGQAGAFGEVDVETGGALIGDVEMRGR